MEIGENQRKRWRTTTMYTKATYATDLQTAILFNHFGGKWLHGMLGILDSIKNLRLDKKISTRQKKFSISGQNFTFVHYGLP